jgi:glycosyltransferase involved in cell wall biosynthesis
MSRKQPLVSVIIPTYNRRETVSRAIESVLDQTYDNLECIVVDDCSTDGTPDLLSSLSVQNSKLRIVSHLHNRHASAARNTGLLAATGDYLAFLDDDDTWLPNKLELQVDLMGATSARVGLVYCWFDVYRGGAVVGTRRPTLRGNVFKHLLLSQPLGNASTLLVRRDVVDEIGGFDENLPRGNDGDFIRRVAERYEVEVVPEVLVHYFAENEGKGNPRITGNDRQSILNAIRGHEAKLSKFPDFLVKNPKVHAALFCTIARHYAQLGKVQKGFCNLMAAHRLSPFLVYGQALRVIWNYCFRRTR